MFNVQIIAEGQTERLFIDKILKPYCAERGVYLWPCTLVHKPGQDGGDVKFERVCKDVCQFLKQQKDLIVCTFVDYYGLKSWPRKEQIGVNDTPSAIAALLNDGAVAGVRAALNNDERSADRYIPYTAVHEFEALLFSDSKILAEELHIRQQLVDEVLAKFDTPEYINNSPQTAPSKRIKKWVPRYIKTVTGIEIARKIGVEKMREACPLFDEWLEKLTRRVRTQ